jgi:hypothetical protein
VTPRLIAVGRVSRIVLLAAALAGTLAVAGCGNRVEERTLAETEGLYLDIGDLKYQVQISRQLNPADVEDKSYLLGLPEGTPEPAADETWFGIFLRVQNETDEPLPAADTFEIIDTQENVFRPIPLDPEQNPFAYQAIEVPPRTVIPEPDAADEQGPVQGALILFKVKTESLANRPLEFRFSNGPQGTQGIVDLDV